MVRKVYSRKSNIPNIHWEYWYDHSVRVWYAARFDQDGHQQGDALDSFNSEGILNLIRRAENESA